MIIDFIPIGELEALQRYSLTAINRTLKGDIVTPWSLISVGEGTGIKLGIKALFELGCKDILTVSFHDVDGNNNVEGMQVFNKYHAENIRKFIHDVHYDERLIVHCSAGISRSAAIACYAAEVNGFDPYELFAEKSMYPNMWVWNMLRKD